jgi:hypothetical protein
MARRALRAGSDGVCAAVCVSVAVMATVVALSTGVSAAPRPSVRVDVDPCRALCEVRCEPPPRANCARLALLVFQ